MASAPHTYPTAGDGDFSEDVSTEKLRPPTSVQKRVLFCEFFAGTGALTDAVRAVGIDCRDPDEFESGGVDFDQVQQVGGLKDELRSLSSQGWQLALHLAPPCATFSRARDRRPSTRLRSMDTPLGLAPSNDKVQKGNRIGRRALDLAEWVMRELGAHVLQLSMGSPRDLVTLTEKRT